MTWGLFAGSLRSPIACSYKGGAAKEQHSNVRLSCSAAPQNPSTQLKGRQLCQHSLIQGNPGSPRRAQGHEPIAVLLTG